jgi:hypothetical protein
VYFQKPIPPATGYPPYVCKDNIEAVVTIWAFAEAYGVNGYEVDSCSTELFDASQRVLVHYMQLGALLVLLLLYWLVKLS